MIALWWAGGERLIRPLAALTALVGAASLIAGGFLAERTYLVLAPGGALQVSERVAIAGAVDPVNGKLLLTTVRLADANPAALFMAWIDEHEVVVERARVIPEDVPEQEFFEAQRELFEESGRIAAAVGMRAAGLDVTVSGKGARVEAVLEGSPADGILQEGDVIVEANGTPIRLASDLINVTSGAQHGDTLTLTVQRGGATETVTVTLGAVEGLQRPALGIAITTVDLDVTLPREVTIDSERIGGPSAGLMTALTVYDLVAEEDLAAGRVIAGTGTIDLDGQVGPVGGVTQKVAAAREAGASVFLVPAAEAEEARAAAGDGIEVVVVETFDDALAALRATPKG